MNRSAAVLKASRSTFPTAAAGLRHSRSPALGLMLAEFGAFLPDGTILRQVLLETYIFWSSIKHC